MALAQLVGFAGMAMNILAYQRNTRKGIIGMQTMGSAFFFLHFLLLGRLDAGAYTAAFLNVVGVARNIVFLNREKRWGSHRAWLYAFILAFAAVGIVTWESPLGLLSVGAVIAGTVAFYSKKPGTIRRLSLICSSGWMAYDIIYRSIPGVICEILTLSSIFAAMWRFDFRKKEPESAGK